MRDIKYIVLHCTATPQTTKIASIQRYWKDVLKWRNAGYHYIIEPNGDVTNFLPESQIANGVAGYNSTSIHVSYIGGVDGNNKPLDNRTPEQIEAQIRLVLSLKASYPNAKVLGHRDFPKVNKACPSFDVAEWIKSLAGYRVV